MVGKSGALKQIKCPKNQLLMKKFAKNHIHSRYRVAHSRQNTYKNPTNIYRICVYSYSIGDSKLSRDLFSMELAQPVIPVIFRFFPHPSDLSITRYPLPCFTECLVTSNCKVILNQKCWIHSEVIDWLITLLGVWP